MQDELRRKLREVEGVQSALDNEQRLTSELRKTAGEERQRYMQEAQARGAGLQGWRRHLLGFGVVQACALHSRCTLPLCWRNSTHRLPQANSAHPNFPVPFYLGPPLVTGATRHTGGSQAGGGQPAVAAGQRAEGAAGGAGGAGQAAGAAGVWEALRSAVLTCSLLLGCGLC